MRDIRFVAVHRGGLLEPVSHRALAAWAADTAATVLPLFSQTSPDPRPGRAVEIGAAWSRGEVAAGAAMRASVAAHAAAREATDAAAMAAARAAGQAVATAHCADHCLGALLYALKARALAGMEREEEMARLLEMLPCRLRPMVVAGIEARLRHFIRIPKAGAPRIREPEAGNSRGRTRDRIAAR